MASISSSSSDLSVAPKPHVGIGSCLVGEPVRFNGDHKRRNPHIDTLATCFDLVSLCPEVGIGLGVPRKPIRLVQTQKGAPLRAMDSDTQSQDYTDALAGFADRQQQAHAFCGYILVKASPSCGFEKVKRYNARGKVIANDSMGVFAQQLRNNDPLLPMEDDGRLFDTGLRESFVQRVFLYQAWREFANDPFSVHGLTSFYARYKYQIMAHDVASYKKLGPLQANTKARDLKEVANELIQGMMQALQKVATRGSRSNALQHIQGYLKKVLSPKSRNFSAAFSNTSKALCR